MPLDPSLIRDPLVLADEFWPEIRFYDKQRDVIRSVWSNDETVVVAGNQLGKDFVAGFICVIYFLMHPVVRVITTSVKDDHLRVLWGEIGRFIDTCKYPLTSDKGGPLVLRHRDIRKLMVGRPLSDGVECKISYLLGMVSAKGEGMAGHHAPNTLLVIDEASGVDQVVYTQGCTWTDGPGKHRLIFGNPNACPPTHFFRLAVEAGDLLAQEQLAV